MKYKDIKQIKPWDKFYKLRRKWNTEDADIVPTDILSVMWLHWNSILITYFDDEDWNYDIVEWDRLEDITLYKTIKEANIVFKEALEADIKRLKARIKEAKDSISYCQNSIAGHRSKIKEINKNIE